MIFWDALHHEVVIKLKRLSKTLWGNPPVTGGFPLQRPVTRRFYVSLVCVWTNVWTISGIAVELRRHEVPVTLLWWQFRICILWYTVCLNIYGGMLDVLQASIRFHIVLVANQNKLTNKGDVKCRNTIDCLDQYTCTVLRKSLDI